MLEKESELCFYLNSFMFTESTFLKRMSLSETGALVKLIALATTLGDCVYIPEDAHKDYLCVKDKCLDKGLLVKTERPLWYKFTCRGWLYRLEGDLNGQAD